MDKTFTRNVSDKALVFLNTKSFHISVKRIKTLIGKWAKDMNRQFMKKYNWLIQRRKNTSSHDNKSHLNTNNYYFDGNTNRLV